MRSLGYSSKNIGGSSIVLKSNNVKYFNLSDVSRVFNEFSRISMGRKVVIADASQ